MKAFIFPGQGSQKLGMGADLYAKSKDARTIFETANDILGERFSDFLFTASEDELMDTRHTQMGIFVYEVAVALSQKDITPDFVAGHSLGEYAALVTCGALDFEEGVRFIKKRGEVFYEAFKRHPSAMGAIIGIDENVVKSVLETVSNEDGENLYIANYNGPGQLVITGGIKSIRKSCKILKNMGAKRALMLPQKGVGHSPNSETEGKILSEYLTAINWHEPKIPIFQDVDGMSHTDISEIINNQIKLMTYPVQWTSIINNMVNAGVCEFYECGTEDTLQKIVKRMCPTLKVSSIWEARTYNGIEPFKQI